jgi:hypothetical protein
MGKNQDPGSGINIPDPQHWSDLFSGSHMKDFKSTEASSPAKRISSSSKYKISTAFFSVVIALLDQDPENQLHLNPILIRIRNTAFKHYDSDSDPKKIISDLQHCIKLAS